MVLKRNGCGVYVMPKPYVFNKDFRDAMLAFLQRNKPFYDYYLDCQVSRYLQLAKEEAVKQGTPVKRKFESKTYTRQQFVEAYARLFGTVIMIMPGLEGMPELKDRFKAAILKEPKSERAPKGKLLEYEGTFYLIYRHAGSSNPEQKGLIAATLDGTQPHFVEKIPQKPGVKFGDEPLHAYKKPTNGSVKIWEVNETKVNLGLNAGDIRFITAVLGKASSPASDPSPASSPASDPSRTSSPALDPSRTSSPALDPLGLSMSGSFNSELDATALATIDAFEADGSGPDRADGSGPDRADDSGPVIGDGSGPVIGDGSGPDRADGSGPVIDDGSALHTPQGGSVGGALSPEIFDISFSEEMEKIFADGDLKDILFSPAQVKAGNTGKQGSEAGDTGTSLSDSHLGISTDDDDSEADDQKGSEKSSRSPGTPAPRSELWPGFSLRSGMSLLHM